jgi:pSer/pThr/pTyr-binding forkhead associated (FHA) protein
MNAFPQPPSSDSEIFDIPTIDASFTIVDQSVVSLESRRDNPAPIRAVNILAGNGIKIRVERGCRQSVGRAKLADIVIPTDGMLSRQHLSLECTGEQIVVRDLGSMNGTFVNGRRVQLARLRNHDQIIAGSTVFTVRVEYESE